MHSTSSLIDVMIVNSNLEKQTVIYDLGYSDHLAQIVYIKLGTPVLSPIAIQKRQFTDTTIEEFIYFLQQESWDEVLSMEDVSLAFNPLVPNNLYIRHTAQLTSRRCILNIYSTTILTEYFRHAARSPFFFSLQDAVYFIMLPFFGSCNIHILNTVCAKI